MTRDELEFQISQYLDGTLSPSERAALEERVAGDVEARELLAEYRRLDGLLTRSLPVSAVNWDRLAEHLSAEVAGENAPAVIGRIMPAAWSWRSRLSIAASFLIVLGVGSVLYKVTHDSGSNRVVQNVNVESTAYVMGPQEEPAAGPVTQEITVGPSPTLAAEGDAWRYAEGVVTRPSSAIIAGNMKPQTDGDSYIR